LVDFISAFMGCEPFVENAKGAARGSAVGRAIRGLGRKSQANPGLS
jgi:hypothetical protein